MSWVTIIDNSAVVFLLLVAFGTFVGSPACDAIATTILAVAVYLLLEWLGYFPFVPGWLLLGWAFAFGTSWYVETRRHRVACDADRRPRVTPSGRDRVCSTGIALGTAVVLMLVGAW